MKIFKVASLDDLRKMVKLLEDDGHTIIYRDEDSFNAFKGGKLVRVVKIGRVSAPER